MTRWGKDNEERAAVAQKAQDAYAAARSAASRAEGAAAAVEGFQGALEAAMRDIAALQRSNAALAVRVDELERGRQPAKLTRKAA